LGQATKFPPVFRGSGQVVACRKLALMPCSGGDSNPGASQGGPFLLRSLDRLANLAGRTLIPPTPE